MILSSVQHGKGKVKTTKSDCITPHRSLRMPELEQSGTLHKIYIHSRSGDDDSPDIGFADGTELPPQVPGDLLL